MYKNQTNKTITPLKIAIISSQPYAPPWSEGVRNLMRRIAHDFTSRGVKVTVISPKTAMAITCGDAGELIINVPSTPKWLRGITRSKVRLAATHTPRQPDQELNVLSAPKRRLRVITQGRLWLAAAHATRRIDPEPDVLLLIASVSSVLGMRTMLLKIGSRKPLAVYVTGLSRPRVGYSWGLSADRVFVGNEFLQQWFPGSSIIYPFLPLNVTRDNMNLERQDGTFNVLFLGSFQPQRGVEYLLQAMALVKGRTKKRVKLIIAWNGGGPDNYQNILRLIGTLGISSIVDMRGRMDTSLLYSEADILVIPRVSQELMAFPVRIVEALHMRKPIIVTRVCGMENLVKECGLAVEPRNAEALSQAILKLAHNETLRKQLEVNCVKASRQFDSSISLDKLFNELRMIADND